ncbi:hypothetical protein COX58_01770 [archaeon CG_4_10_14_0_2_um_filter_Archaea_38_6]|nr:MAG: hypothetical protein COS83_04105 [archaeon CG07_land_8_20_14_0_80_38_8]PIU88800.1 MAG: hypothetical protein COS64_02365 [archaeon CG06_land_8_20_14_3_00_37_11]PJA22578.1 MAG: hypothetical protein COX58_01770 [archaeon CG_4_10_14_0_2_um_filter_Archaea_38_6]
MEAMIVLSKEETNSKIKKLEKELLAIFQEFNVIPQEGIATEMSFMVDMPENDLKKITKIIEERAKPHGFELEVIKQ